MPAEVSTFIGRALEVERLLGLLARTRLLTLVGAGGVGKTRLACHVALEVQNLFPDGVWFVEFASLADDDLMPRQVAEALRVRERFDPSQISTLVEHLSSKRMLLVLDNCEHLLESGATLTNTLLQGCPWLHVLATSREPLRVGGEMIWSVPPLALPNAIGPESLESLRKCEAVQLFLDRAVAAIPDFDLTPDNARSVVEICTRLDGIPLAIELAAARLRVFSVGQVAARLDDRFRLLTNGSRTAPPRHRTLGATVEWSYELLTTEERALFTRLAVFANGWSLEAAEVVCAGGSVEASRVWEILGHLVDKSLVAAQVGRGVARYRLLDTMRQFGWDRLIESGEEALTIQRYIHYFVALGEQAQPQLNSGSAGAAWLERLVRDQDNLRQALRWSIERSGLDRGLKLGEALWQFRFLQDSLTDGREWLQTVLRLVRGSQAGRTADWATALNVAGVLVGRLGDYSAATALLEESLAIAHELGDDRLVCASLNNMGKVVWSQGEHGIARTLLEESLEMAQAAGDALREAVTLRNLAQLLEDQGHPLVSDAVHTNSDTTAHRRPPARRSQLTARELEVVRLLAAGKTNREIADILVIAPSTTERHVANILAKLRLRSRGQIAVWAVTQRIVFV